MEDSETAGDCGGAMACSSVDVARSALGKQPRKGILKKKNSTDSSFDQTASFDSGPPQPYVS